MGRPQSGAHVVLTAPGEGAGATPPATGQALRTSFVAALLPMAGT